jgi:phosphoglycolate phosphatase
LWKNLGLSKEEIDQTNLIYKKEIVKKDPSIFEGIKEVIDSLSKEYELILLSSNIKEEVIQKLTKFHLIDKFKLIFASDIVGPLKKSQAIPEILEKTGSTPEEIAMIADRNIDYDIGVRSGLKSENIIIVEYGWGYDKDKIPKQNVIINKPEDLLGAIDAINKR